MQMLAETEMCGGYFRYLPVKRLDAETRKRSLERFLDFQGKGVLRECSFYDDIWNATDELRQCRIDFSFDTEKYDAHSRLWIGCTSECYRECLKAYAALLLGDYALVTIKGIIKDLAGMAGDSAEEVLKGHPEKNYHRAAFLSLIPLGNDIRDHVIEELEDMQIRRKNKNQRNLADFHHYLAFDHALKEYWSHAEEADKRKYFPVYFWWSLTSVLPLRATEFLMTPWDCIGEKDGRYFLTVRRTKLKKGEKHSYKISEDYALHSYPIPQDIYHEIDWYKKTAPVHLIPDIDTLLVPEGAVPSGYFTFCQMQRRLRQFYKEVLGDEAYPVHLGDTRHLAMVNLILSGGSPVVCRELAGHEDIDISSHYYSNMSGVVESVIVSQFRGWDPDSAISGTKRYCLSVPLNSIRVKNGWCDYPGMACGDVSGCVSAYVPGGMIGDCCTCRHFCPDRKGLQLQIEKDTKKQVDEDGIYLMQMISLVRKSMGYEEDIDEALLRIRGSAERYGKLLKRKYREEL